MGMMEAIQRRRDGHVDLAERDRGVIAEQRRDPAFGHLHADSDQGFVLGFVPASRQDGDTVLFG